MMRMRRRKFTHMHGRPVRYKPVERKPRRARPKNIVKKLTNVTKKTKGSFVVK